MTRESAINRNASNDAFSRWFLLIDFTVRAPLHLCIFVTFPRTMAPLEAPNQRPVFPTPWKNTRNYCYLNDGELGADALVNSIIKIPYRHYGRLMTISSKFFRLISSWLKYIYIHIYIYIHTFGLLLFRMNYVFAKVRKRKFNGEDTRHTVTGHLYWRA